MSKSTFLALAFAVPLLLPSAGQASWPPAGTPVCVNSAEQDYPMAASDGMGGMFVVWADNRSNPNIFDVFGVRLLSSGDLAPGWPTNGKFLASNEQILADLIPDGAGGAYVVYEPIGNGFDVYAQHLTATGSSAPGWPPSGLAIGTGPGAQDEARAAVDDSGGVYIVWDDVQLNQVRGIRLHADGTVAPGWAVGGRILSTGGSYAAHSDIAPDGAGGIVATWWEQRPPATDYPAYGFRITPGGDPYPGWPAGGVLLSQHRPAHLQYQAYVASDGAGGMYCVWADLRNMPPGTPADQAETYWDIYGQHVLGNGTIASGWSSDATPIAVAPREQVYPRVVGDGLGGAFAVWNDYRNVFSGDPEAIFAQHLLPNGLDLAWMLNGNPVVSGPGYKDLGFHDDTEVISDAHGGLYVGFTEISAERVYLQHMMADGTLDPMYAPAGILMTPSVSAYQNYVAIAPDGNGGVYATWNDSRGPSDPSNVWATHISSDQPTGIALALMTSDVHLDHVVLVWQAPQFLRASVERREGSGAWQTLADVSTDGEYRLAYDDHSVTQGSTYTYRLSYGDGTTTAYGPESTVLVPRAFTLALAGFRPNPSTSGDAAVAFELPDSKPGRLELLDVSGRRIADRDLSAFAAGRYVVRLGEGARVPAGMYWIRLTHGGKALTSRGVVIR